MQSCCVPGDITISSGMTFARNSDFSGESVEFTLTCISTGGPANTVTWTRNSDNVTDSEGTETVLENRTTAQYTHTLTVTEKLGGLYTCTVANNKPSNDTAELTVEGNGYIVNVIILFFSSHCDDGLESLALSGPPEMFEAVAGQTRDKT